MKISAIIQARMSSTRLPGKVLKELPYVSGISVLSQVIRRTRKSKRVSDIVVATTVESGDDEIVKLAEREEVLCHRGSRNNVLERYYEAAKKNHSDVILRITSDCPCLDYEVIDEVIDEHFKTNSDYTSNSLKRTFPRGFDAEVFNFSTLEKASRNATQNFEREHVTPYIYKTNPGVFRIHQVKASSELHAPDIRVTLDTAEDYALLCAVYDYLYGKNAFFSGKDVVGLFKEKPWLSLINQQVVQKTV